MKIFMRITCLIICIFAATMGGVSLAYAASKQPANLEHMVGQMIMVGFRGMDKATEGNMPKLLDSIRKGHVGGVILFNYDVVLKSDKRNIRSLEQVTKLSKLLQDSSSTPLFVAIDQEGGKVRRIRPEHGAPFDLPSAEDMGNESVEETRTWGEKTGKLLQSVGININFAPSVDVNANPHSPIIGKVERSFSEDENEIVNHAKAFAEGLAKYNIIATYKHFPGHGSALTDTHVGMTDITKTWQDDELTPYLPQNRPQVPLIIMTGHLFLRSIDPDYPSTLSDEIITNLLRKKLAWNGVVASDDMQMQAMTSHYSRREAVRLAITAGVDLLVTGNNLLYNENVGEELHAEIMSLIAEGHISEKRIKQSYTRIMKLKESIGLVRAGSW